MAYSYYRVNISDFTRNGSTTNFACFDELYLYDSDGNDIATSSGCVYTASSSYNSENGPTNAFDRRTGTLWHSAVNGSAQWICVQLTSAVDILSFGIKPRGDGWADYINSFTFEGSNDGHDWNVLLEKTDICGTWSQGTEQIFKVPVKNTKYLVRDSDKLYTVTDGALSEITGTLSADLFQNSGVDDIPDGTLLMTLSDPEVLCWRDEDTEPTLTATVTGVPYPQIIISEKIYLTDKSITGIESVLATCEGELIVAVSFDDKQTWKAWNGEQWATLSDDNTGMSKEALEGITFEQWNELYTGATGFYVRVSLLDTTQSVEKIVFDFAN